MDAVSILILVELIAYFFETINYYNFSRTMIRSFYRSAGNVVIKITLNPWLG